MSRFDEIAQEDGWQVDGFAGALEFAAADGIAWKLLDLTMDVADREPSEEDIREAMDTGDRILVGLLADLDEAEQRAERAEAELAALRERVRGMADNADMMAAASLSRDFTGKPFLPASVTTDDLRRLLDDDTTGAASGEGEVADSCTYCASQIKQAQERRAKTEQECARLETLRPKPGDNGYTGYAQMFNDITFAPIVTHLLFSDRGRMADALWAAGYRKTEGIENEGETK